MTLVVYFVITHARLSGINNILRKSHEIYYNN
jgi:hypothetical protein